MSVLTYKPCLPQEVIIISSANRFGLLTGFLSKVVSRSKAGFRHANQGTIKEGSGWQR